MLQARPHAIHFKRILDFGEGQPNGIVPKERLEVLVDELDGEQRKSVRLD